MDETGIKFQTAQEAMADPTLRFKPEAQYANVAEGGRIGYRLGNSVGSLDADTGKGLKDIFISFSDYKSGGGNKDFLFGKYVQQGIAGFDFEGIVWIVVDDMSSHFGYQGEKLVNTPHVDRLAKEGVVFSRAYATAPVCSAFRSAMITGMYQTTIGAHHHRSGRGKLKIERFNSIDLEPLSVEELKKENEYAAKKAGID
jgi:hypothetical protein